MEKTDQLLLTNFAQHLSLTEADPPPRFIINQSSCPNIHSSSLSSPPLGQIPFIDISILASLKESNTEIEKLRIALSSWGTFQAVNHGIDGSFLAEVRSVVREFFAQPMEEKMKSSREVNKREGYGHDIIVSDQQILDWTDRLVLSILPEDTRNLHLWPKHPPRFSEILLEYTAKINFITEVVVKAMAISLNLDESSFLDQFGDGARMLGRFNYYPRCSKPDAVLGLKAHTDGAAITVLLQDDVIEGLQIMKDGEWLRAPIIPDALIVNLGDQMQIIIKDVWKEYTGWPLNNMESQYKFMVKHVQLWNVAFHSTSPRWIHSFYLAAVAAFYAKQVEAGLMEYKPDIIISVHPLMQHIPVWVLKWQGLQKKVVFVTVITDLSTCHPTWFHPGVNRCYCPSNEVYKKAIEEGLDESQIRVYGLPIRPSFARANLSKDDLRTELEMDTALPAVLLMGGGEGMGPVKKTAKALAEALFDKEFERPIGQLIIICGRNKSLAESLEALEWKIPVKIRGFETQMQKWMGACDCIITKAGPGTIAEALIRGLPIILNDYIPGQEKGNVPYVVKNGAGVFTRDPKEIARIVAEWFSTKTDELYRMSENARKLSQPEAVFDIVKDIHELAKQRGPLADVPYELTSSFSSLI